MPKFPFGAAAILPSLTATGAQAIAIDNQHTVLSGAVATGNRTINLTIDPTVNAGARLIVVSKTNAGETTAFGTGMLGVTVTGQAGKTKVAEFVFDGNAFVNVSTPVQVD
jgi:hypothetical protein